VRKARGQAAASASSTTQEGGPGPDGARPDPEAVIAVAERAGLRLMKRETFLPFQFFLVFVK
jgi:hypothetical protein